jgi:CelD/BcsL family acetyltransferase involved in cellulose biosynthesis
MSLELIKRVAGTTLGGAGGAYVGGSPGLSERVGRSALLEGTDWLDQMHDKAGVSLLARLQWLQSWAEAFPCWEPWTLALVDRDNGVRAVAPLARRRLRSGIEVVTVGDAALSESPVAACDDGAPAILATGVVEALRSLGCPWTLCLRQLPIKSAVASALVAQLPTATVHAGSRRPVLRFADDRPPKRWLTRNTGGAYAKACNRINREGHHLEVGWVEPWRQIEDLLPELVRVHRACDMELRGSTLLDDDQEAQFYHQVIHRHAGQWRLLAVRIDGSLAAYALCLKDGLTLHVWDNRVAPVWERYSAGLIANAELVMRAASDGSVGAVDWGCGEQRYKTSMSSDVIGAQVLMAWSSPALRSALALGNRFQRLRAIRPATRLSPRRR